VQDPSATDLVPQLTEEHVALLEIAPPLLEVGLVEAEDAERPLDLLLVLAGGSCR